MWLNMINFVEKKHSTKSLKKEEIVPVMYALNMFLIVHVSVLYIFFVITNL